MGIDLTNLAPAAGAGAGCSCGPSSPASKPADVSFELLVELASDGFAAAEPELSLGPAVRQSGSFDPAQHAAPNPGAQQAMAASATLPWQPTPAIAAMPWWANATDPKTSREFDCGSPSLLDEDGATDEAQSRKGPESSSAAVLLRSATAATPVEPPPPPFEEATVAGPGTVSDGTSEITAQGGTTGGGRPAGRPPGTGARMAVPALDADAEAAEADPGVGGWAEGVEQSIRAGEIQPLPVPIAAGSNHAGPSDEPQPSERAARTSPSRADPTRSASWNTVGAAPADQGPVDLTQRASWNTVGAASPDQEPVDLTQRAPLNTAGAAPGAQRPADPNQSASWSAAGTAPNDQRPADPVRGALRNTESAASMDPRRPEGQLEAASHQAVRAMLNRAFTTSSAPHAETGEQPDAAAAPTAKPAADNRPTAGEAVPFSAPGFVDLFQVPADEAVRRYADLLAAQAPTQHAVKPVDSPAPRGAKDAAGADVARAFTLAAMAANPTALGVPASAEPPPAGTPVAAPLTPQIVKAVSLLWRDGIGEARIRLEPEHLGSVTVSLRVERGVVTARMTADVPAVRDWIRTHEADLRNSLASQGLELDQIVVSADPDDRNRQPPPESNRQPRTPRTSRGGPQFQLNA